MLRKLLAATAAVTLAAPAMAGGLAPAAPEPAVIVPVAPVAAPSPNGDWSGFYAGLQAGYADADVTPGTGPEFSVDGGNYGLHVGYLHDFGRFVLGGELRFDDVSDVKSSAGAGDTLTAASLRVGYDMGRILPYLTVGGGQLKIDSGDKSDGILYGLGVDYAVTNNWRVGLEAVRFEFDSFGSSSGIDEITGNNIGLRVSYAF